MGTFTPVAARAGRRLEVSAPSVRVHDLRPGETQDRGGPTRPQGQGFAGDRVPRQRW